MLFNYLCNIETEGLDLLFDQVMNFIMFSV